jgi:ubiquitin-like-conjugating enzyme ATG10
MKRMTENDVAVQSLGRLAEAQFEQLARAFADADPSDGLTWAWVSPARRGAFAPPLGYLTSSQLLVWPPPRPRGAGQPAFASPCAGRLPAEPEDVPAEPEDAASLPPGPEACGIPDALCLHICLSQTFGTPMLLLLGSSAADGRAWGTEEAQLYVRRCAGLTAACLPPNVVTQAEHPVLGGPCCALHPCRTAELLQLMLGASIVGRAAAEERTPPRLDPLLAWWSVVAPLVGARAEPGVARATSAVSNRDSARKERSSAVASISTASGLMPGGVAFGVRG